MIDVKCCGADTDGDSADPPSVYYLTRKRLNLKVTT